jgi:hypothetical protein
MKLIKKTKNIILRTEPNLKQYIACSDADYYLKDKEYVKVILKPTIQDIKNPFLFITNKGLYDSKFIGFDDINEFMKYCKMYSILSKDIGYLTFDVNNAYIKCHCPSCKKEFMEEFDLRYDELPSKDDNGYILYCSECYY